MAASQAFSQKLYEAAARDANAAGTSASGQRARSTTTRSSTPRSSTRTSDPLMDAEMVGRSRPPGRGRRDGCCGARRRPRRGRHRRRGADGGGRGARGARTTSRSCSPSATSSRTSPCGCRRLRELQEARRHAAERRDRPCHRQVGRVAPPVLDACEAAFRATAPTASSRSGRPSWVLSSVRSRGPRHRRQAVRSRGRRGGHARGGGRR